MEDFHKMVLKQIMIVNCIVGAILLILFLLSGCEAQDPGPDLGKYVKEIIEIDETAWEVIDKGGINSFINYLETEATPRLEKIQEELAKPYPNTKDYPDNIREVIIFSLVTRESLAYSVLYVLGDEGEYTDKWRASREEFMNYRDRLKNKY